MKLLIFFACLIVLSFVFASKFVYKELDFTIKKIIMKGIDENERKS